MLILINLVEVSMRLSAKIIKNYINNNVWEYDTQIRIRAGEQASFWLQLVDLDRNIRYISPSATANLNLSVYFASVDDSKKINVLGTVASVDDKSIWVIQLDGSFTPNSGNLFVTFNDNGIIRKFMLLDILKVDDEFNVGGC
jgi:hypothetical protein